MVETTATDACSFGPLTGLVGKYFSSSEALVVKPLLTSMQKAKAGTTGAQSIGLDILVHVANNVKTGNTDVTDGGALVNGLLYVHVQRTCRSLPASFPQGFSATARSRPARRVRRASAVRAVDDRPRRQPSRLRAVLRREAGERGVDGSPGR